MPRAYGHRQHWIFTGFKWIHKASQAYDWYQKVQRAQRLRKFNNHVWKMAIPGRNSGRKTHPYRKKNSHPVGQKRKSSGGHAARKKQKVARKPRYEETNVQGAVISHDYLKISLRKPKKIRTEGKFVYNHQFSFVSELTTTGLQHVNDLWQILRSDQIIKASAKTTSGAVGTSSWSQSAFAMDPNKKTTGGDATDDVFDSVINTGDKDNTTTISGQIYIPRIHGEYNCLNMSNVSASVKVLWFLCQNQCNVTPVEYWTAYMTSTTGGQAAPVQKSTGGVSSTMGYATYDVYGVTPFKNREFEKNWKCIKVSKFDLAAGESKRTNFDVYANYLADYRRVLDQSKSSTNVYMKGVSLSAVVIAKGGPVFVAAASEASSDKVTAGPVKLGWFGYYNVTFQGRPMSTKLPPVMMRTDAQLYSSSTAAAIKLVDQDGEEEAYEEIGD